MNLMEKTRKKSNTQSQKTPKKHKGHYWPHPDLSCLNLGQMYLRLSSIHDHSLLYKTEKTK